MVVKISWPITSLCWILGHCAFGQFNLLDAFLEMGAAVWDWAPGTICGELLRHPWWVGGRIWNQGAICCKVTDTLQILKISYGIPRFEALNHRCFFTSSAFWSSFPHSTGRPYNIYRNGCCPWSYKYGHADQQGICCSLLPCNMHPSWGRPTRCTSMQQFRFYASLDLP